MIILTYYPDTDTLDVRLHSTVERQNPGEVESRRDPSGRIDPIRSETETYEADPSGQTLAHYREGRLDGLTIEHASRRAPEAWDIESLRREAAQVAASTGRLVESVTHDLLHDRTSFQTGESGPQSPHTSDEAVREYNRIIYEIKAASAAA